MKKAILTLLILLFLGKGFVMAQPLHVAVVLPLSGPEYALGFSKKVMDLIRQNPPSGKIRITFLNSEGYLTYTMMEKLIKEQNPQIFVGPTFPFELRDPAELLKGYQSNQHRLFIIPFSNKTLEKSEIAATNNIFILPQPITNTLSVIGKAVEEHGYDMELLKKFLRDEEKIVQNKYLQWEMAIDKMVENGMHGWQKETGGSISSDAASFLERSYTGNTISFLKSYAVLNVDTASVMRRAPTEIVQILNTYYTKTGKKEVDLSSFKSSGVNDCENPPCKTHCCPEYRKWNHECLHKIDCN